MAASKGLIVLGAIGAGLGLLVLSHKSSAAPTTAPPTAPPAPPKPVFPGVPAPPGIPGIPTPTTLPSVPGMPAGTSMDPAAWARVLAAAQSAMAGKAPAGSSFAAPKVPSFVAMPLRPMDAAHGWTAGMNVYDFNPQSVPVGTIILPYADDPAWTGIWKGVDSDNPVCLKSLGDGCFLANEASVDASGAPLWNTNAKGRVALGGTLDRPDGSFTNFYAYVTVTP